MSEGKSFAQRLNDRKAAMEGGDPTGGEEWERRNTEAVRKELGSAKDNSKKSSEARDSARSR